MKAFIFLGILVIYFLNSCKPETEKVVVFNDSKEMVI